METTDILIKLKEKYPDVSVNQIHDSILLEGIAAEVNKFIDEYNIAITNLTETGLRLT